MCPIITIAYPVIITAAMGLLGFKAAARLAAVAMMWMVAVSCAFTAPPPDEPGSRQCADGADRADSALSPARLRRGLLSRETPDGMELQDALEAFAAAAATLPEERKRLADGIVKAIVEDGVDRHEFLAYVPYLQTFQAHEQLTTLLLHDPGEEDYWIECCFYQAVLGALRACGTPADAARLVKNAPDRDRHIFLDLAAAIENAHRSMARQRPAENASGSDRKP